MTYAPPARWVFHIIRRTVDDRYQCPVVDTFSIASTATTKCAQLNDDARVTGDTPNYEVLPLSFAVK